MSDDRESHTKDTFIVGYDRKTGFAYGNDVREEKLYPGITTKSDYKPGTSTGYVPGIAWRFPTFWERVVSEITGDAPVVIYESDNRTHYLTYERSGQALSLPFYPSDSAHTGGILEQCEAKATTTGLNGLRSTRGPNEPPERKNIQLQLGADAAEVRKSLDMMGGAMSSTLEAFKQVRQRNYFGALEALGLSGKISHLGRDPANAWLQLQYGWKPTVQSVYDTYKKMHEKVRDKALTFSSVGTAGGSDQDKRIYPHILGTHHEAIFTYHCKVKSQFYFRIDNQVLGTIDEIGLLNPASVAWELLPYSFVVDWFIPVGNVLSALSATAGLEFVAGYQSTLEERSLSSHVVKNQDTGKDTSVLSGGSYHWKSTRFKRRPYTSFPLPEFYANENPFSTAHVQNGLALLRQLL